MYITVATPTRASHRSRRGSIRQLYDRYAGLNIQDLARRNQSTGFSGSADQPLVKSLPATLAATRAESSGM